MTARRLRIGVMGGTFDPIHHGHLVAASEAAVALNLDEVIFVPTGNPDNKKVISSPEHRYLMTVIATAANPRFTVSRIDIDRPGVTYTIDTLTELSKLRPDSDLFFISGADAIAQILAWKEVDRIWPLAHFVAVTRPGHQLQLPQVKEARISQLEVPALAISSTDVRNRAAVGKPIWYLVPDGVVQYIAKHKLYRGQSDSVHN
jgi:nicotinate-nucleotide adenylyltransferase